MNVVQLMTDKQVKLIESIEQSIEQYSLKEAIDCIISAIELRQELLDDKSEELKDLNMIHEFFEALSTLSEDLAEDATTALGCRQIRRRARDRFLGNIADYKVM